MTEPESPSATPPVLIRHKVTRTIPAQAWERIECLSSMAAGFTRERSRPNGRHTDPDIVRAFGSHLPHSREALLHYFKGWDRGEGTPVLLVHGARYDASWAWIHPWGHSGLAPWLATRSGRVFAVTFAHYYGDNLLWAEQIANALARIRQVTGASRVDVVAHSQGTVAARALVSGVRQPWMTPYQGEVRRLVLVAGPHLGLDYTFRHPVVNLGLYPESSQPFYNAPMSWTKMLVMGMWADTSAQTLYKDFGDYFPGQAQMLARWDHEYPLPLYEPDVLSTYNGGHGFMSLSPGIDAAIAQGGDFIARLRRSSLDPAVELAVLAGSKADLAHIHNEHTAPSDGAIFVKSATATEDMTRGGARLVASRVLSLNHMELICAPPAKAWITAVLRRR